MCRYLIRGENENFVKIVKICGILKFVNFDKKWIDFFEMMKRK